MTITQKVGKMLCLMRMSQGITLGEMVTKTSHCKASIINIEKGRQAINVEQLDLFTKALNAGILDVFDFDSLKGVDWKKLGNKVQRRALELKIKQLEREDV